MASSTNNHTLLWPPGLQLLPDPVPEIPPEELNPVQSRMGNAGHCCYDLHQYPEASVVKTFPLSCLQLICSMSTIVPHAPFKQCDRLCCLNHETMNLEENGSVWYEDCIQYECIDGVSTQTGLDPFCCLDENFNFIRNGGTWIEHCFIYICQNGTKVNLGRDPSCAACETDPCYPGVLCKDISTPPYYQCGPCPLGFIGDGINCTCETNVLRKECCAGYARLNGTLMCGIDTDGDGFADNEDNCPFKPNSGQEDADQDGKGDVCVIDADSDGVWNDWENCKFTPNRDQADYDNDTVGDACDNCPNVPNKEQTDSDRDGFGDACDDDSDNDGVLDINDNCPITPNPAQNDFDGDGVGDACDNCPEDINPDQKDDDMNYVGNICQNDQDLDSDGVQDDIDNCPNIPNNNQLDADGDGKGDVCDDDIDNDNIPNNIDNCPLIANANQQDMDGDNVGDACQGDNDNDGVLDEDDTCPDNALINGTNFSKFTEIQLGSSGLVGYEPVWEIKHNGAEIIQLVNSDPSIALGNLRFGGVNFEGTFCIANLADDDFVGFVFSFQTSGRFYLVSWKKSYQESAQPGTYTPIGEAGIQLKLVASKTGPGAELSNALWHSSTVENQTEVLWSQSNMTGWIPNTAYRWRLLHRPLLGLMRLRIYKVTELLVDSGNVFNNELRGGKLGVYCLSQPLITWSNLRTRCTDDVPQQVYDELPTNLQNQVNIDDPDAHVTGF